MNCHTTLLLASMLCAVSLHSKPDQAAAKHAGERGNWVKKREWVKQAQVSSEQLQKDVLAVQKSKKQFYTEFETFEGFTNDFYRKKGFHQGKIDELVAELKADVQAEKDVRIAKARGKSQGEGMPFNYYDIQIEAIEDDVKRFTKEVEQFRFDMKAIADVDRSLNERLRVLDKHAKEASSLSEKSAAKLEAMWWMIDDRKAREAYYEIKGFADRAASIKKYIEGPLLQDFKKVGQTLKQQIEQVESQIKSIEERGVLVEHRTERLERQKAKREELERQLQAQQEAEDADEQPRRRRRKQSPSLVDRIMAPIGATVRLLMTPFRYVASFFTSSTGATRGQAKRRARRRARRQEARAEHTQD